MQDRPTVDELLDAVQGFLRDDLVPVLDGQPKFHARVAANAIAIVRRELEIGAGLAEEERARLQDLLGTDGDREVLNQQLADMLRNGTVPDTQATLAHLSQTAEEKLAVANPRYKPESADMGNQD